MKNH